MKSMRSSRFEKRLSFTLLIISIFALGMEDANAGAIASGKACSSKEFLKTVPSGGKYFMCAEGPNGLQWYPTESPAATKKRNDALTQKNNSNDAWSQQASNAWSNVVQSANYALQRASSYDSGSTGHTVPGDLRQLIYNVGVSASNAANLYAVAPDKNAAAWAQKAISLANTLQRVKQSYQAQGEETLMPEISLLLTKVGVARGYSVSK